MAKVVKNIITQGLSGSLGHQISFRHDAAGRTILGLKPTRNGDHTGSERQLAHQERFRKAVAYARVAARTEPAYAAQATALHSAFNVAVADWFREPEIAEVDLTGWNGNAGEVIRIQAHDDVEVQTVRVTVMDGSGGELEAGTAERVNGWWVYTTRNSHPLTSPVHIVARDLPGHEAHTEVHKN